MTNRTLRTSGPAQPAAARAHNRAVLLQGLFADGPASRAHLARTTGLTRVTVSAVVEELLEEGYVEELGPEDAPTGKVGKRATLVGLSETTWRIASVSLTNDGLLSGAILTLGGRIVHRHVERERLPRGEEGVAELTAFCRRVVGDAGGGVLGLGVSSPGIVTASGVIEEAPNRGWHDVDLAGRLGGALDLPVLVANDANCAALGEYTFGTSTGEGLLRILVGHGVGAGLVVGGALVRGPHDAAGEIGHVTVVDERDDEALGVPLTCACGRSGCLETLLSEPALRRARAELAPTDLAAHLAAVGVRLGRLLAPVVAVLNITDVVASGPDDLLDGPLLEAAADTIRSRTLPRSHRSLRVGLSRLGEDGALRGAAVLVLSDRLGIA